jgi:hypothetical protein
MSEIPVPDAELSIVDDKGVMSDVFQRWVTEMTNLDLIIGTGTPEGVIEATVGREYLDDAGAAGAVKFIKQSADIAGDRTKGWVAV